MSESRWQRVSKLLEDVAALPVDRRAAFLDEQCGEDQALRAEVESLLEHDVVATHIDEVVRKAAGAAVGDAAAMPRNIAGYRILRVLGEGGMGVVYEAEQDRPRRTVALKVIRAGAYADERSVRMFEREAQALARLKHPGIAPIYEVGRTADGQPFFAMELVRGARLTDFLRDRPSPFESRAELRFRLELFRKICDAVHYAHQRGVIHRDLKPSNIMVPRATEEIQSDASAGDSASVRILDFGMARIIDPDVSAVSAMSEAGRVVGTLAYMSPEQARGNPDEIDVRTDIYSLGIVLYEVLTGRRPYEVGTGAFLEALRMICEEAPASLSDSVRTRRIDADLETIVMKALEKTPERRYQSISTLAGDVVRYLTDQPITARPPSAVYQIRKLVRRHKFAFGLAATFVAFLLALGGVTAWANLRLSVMNKELTAANRDANAARDAETEAIGFLTAVILEAPRVEAKRATVSLHDVLERAEAELAQRDDLASATRARMFTVLGSVATGLDKRQEARRLLESAIIEASQDESAYSLRVRGFAEFWLGFLADDEERYADALQHLDRARHLRERSAEEDRDKLLGETWALIGIVRRNMGQPEETRQALGSALDFAARAGSDGDDAAISANGTLAQLALDQSRLAEARGRFEQALDLLESLPDPDESRISTYRNNLAGVEFSLGNFTRARALNQSVLEYREQHYEADHTKIAEALNNLGESELMCDDPASAAERFQRAADIYLRLKLPQATTRQIALGNLGLARVRLGQAIDAEFHLRGAVDALAEDPRGWVQGYIARFRAYLGTALADQERHDEAAESFQAAIAPLEADPSGFAVPLADVLEEYAVYLRTRGRDAEAAEAEERAAAARRTAAAT